MVEETLTPREIAPGIILIGRYGWLDTGVWLFYHESECVILEMPDHDPEDPKSRPWQDVAGVIQDRGFRPKFITATHRHLDHFDQPTIREFFKQFPDVPIITHESFFPEIIQRNQISPEYLQGSNLAFSRRPSVMLGEVPVFTWKGRLFETRLSTEPYFIFHVPKHSRSDTMHCFRGSMITGDWWLGPGDPNPNRVPLKDIQESIAFLQEFTRTRNYHINSLFSVHANEFRRDIDFHALMEETRVLGW